MPPARTVPSGSENPRGPRRRKNKKDHPEYRAFLKHVGANLRRARWAADKTLEQVAADVLTFRLLAELERGRGNPTLLTLFLLGQELDVAVKDLVDVELAKPGRTPLKEREAIQPKQGRKPTVRRFPKKKS